MGAQPFDYGRAELKAFREAVDAGTVQFDESAALAAKHQYDLMINGLMKIAENLQHLDHATGFGGFDSGHELAAGFSQKAVDGVAVINELIDAAMQLQEAYLRSAGKFADAEQVNTSRIQFAAQETGGGRNA